MMVLVGVVSFALFKTRYGLHVRAVGEHPRARGHRRHRRDRVRYINVVLGGAIAGIGGAAFMAAQGQFQVGYTSGLWLHRAGRPHLRPLAAVGRGRRLDHLRTVGLSLL